MRFEAAKSMLQEASGEQMSTLQQELEQLHTSTGQMKVDLEASQHSQIGTQRIRSLSCRACNVFDALSVVAKLS